MDAKGIQGSEGTLRAIKTMTLTQAKPKHNSNHMPSGLCLTMTLIACPVGPSPDLT